MHISGPHGAQRSALLVLSTASLGSRLHGKQRNSGLARGACVPKSRHIAKLAMTSSVRVRGQLRRAGVLLLAERPTAARRSAECSSPRRFALSCALHLLSSILRALKSRISGKNVQITPSLHECTQRLWTTTRMEPAVPRGPSSKSGSACLGLLPGTDRAQERPAAIVWIFAIPVPRQPYAAQLPRWAGVLLPHAAPSRPPCSDRDTVWS